MSKEAAQLREIADYLDAAETPAEFFSVPIAPATPEKLRQTASTKLSKRSS